MPESADPLVIVLHAIARETGSGIAQIGPEDRLLDVLHLNSLAVTRIVTSAAKALGIRGPAMPRPRVLPLDVHCTLALCHGMAEAG